MRGINVMLFEGYRQKVLLRIFRATLIFFLAGGTCPAATSGAKNSGQELKILFVGNSYIYVNDLPGVFSGLARAGGHATHVDSVAYPGWTLEQHAHSSVTRSLISQKSWDYIVLQEQSVLPVFSADRRRRMIPAARILKKEAQAREARILLLMTWAHRDGLNQTGLNTFVRMGNALAAAYQETGQELGIAVIPVGSAWQEARRQKPLFPLWQEDGSHPSQSGTYLTACVFYAALFKESPVGLECTAGLTQRTCAFLQNVAAATVLNK